MGFLFAMGMRVGLAENICRTYQTPTVSDLNVLFLFSRIHTQQVAYNRNGLPRAALGGAAGDLSKYPQRAKEAILRPDRVELRRGIIPPLSPGSSVSPA